MTATIDLDANASDPPDLSDMSGRRGHATTPARLRQLSVLLVAGVIVLGAVAAGAIGARKGAADEIAHDASPLLVNAEELYVRLAHADATASRSYLAGGSETTESLDRYNDDIVQASQSLADIGRHAGSAPRMQAAVNDLGHLVPAYTALVATARENNRHGNPVGTAYLRSASESMREEMLPRATEIYQTASDRLQSRYDAATSWIHIAAIALVGVLLAAGLVASQMFVTRRSNRLLNPCLIAASVLVVVLLGWLAIQLSSAQDSLATAEREGSSPVEVLAASRILALRAEAASSVAVIERDPADVGALTEPLGGTDGKSGALRDTFAVAPQTAAHSADVIATYTNLVQSMQDVNHSLENFKYDEAVKGALGQQKNASAAFDETLGDDLRSAQGKLYAASDHARAGFTPLLIGLLAVCALSAGLVLAGFEQRIREYR